MPIHWLLWDGSCGMCSASAQWVRNRDKNRLFNICQAQSCPSPPMTPELMGRSGREMLVVAHGGQVLGGARAFLFVLEQTGAKWVKVFGLPPLVWIVDGVYRLIAMNRGFISKTFFKTAACGMENRFPEVDAQPRS